MDMDFIPGSLSARWYDSTKTCVPPYLLRIKAVSKPFIYQRVCDLRLCCVSGR
jgi:hypothetical protein